jgi:DNA-binding transcriptional LysR family regulator
LKVLLEAYGSFLFEDKSVTAISDFDIFARVARTGNMSAAGREMGLSPAVVSKRISLLEERLGARLFQRTTRQLTLTETGEGYFRRVVDILSLIAEADDFVSRRNTNPRGQLKVTAPTSFSRYHLAPYLSKFLDTFPEIQLDLHLTDNFVDIIRDGFDLAIRIGELQDSSLVARKLSPDTRVIVASPGYLEKNSTPKTLKDLENHNCLSAGAQDVWALEGPGGHQEIRVKGNIRSNSADLIREALIGGLGIGLRGTWEVAPEIQNGKLKIVLPQYRGSSKMAIYAVYPSRDFMPAKVDVFLDFLGQHFGPDPYWDKNLVFDAGAAPAKIATRAVKAKRAIVD